MRLKLTALVISTVFLISIRGTAAAEQVQSKESSFSVKYQDGSTERYKVYWTGNVSWSQNESGRPWTLDHPYDDRRCHWDIDSSISRQISMVNRLGLEAVYSRGERSLYGAHFHNDGGALTAAVRPENCGDTVARRDSDIDNSRVDVRGRFDAATKADLESVKQLFRENADVVSVDFK